MFGFFSLAYGFSQIVMGVHVRQAGHTLHSVMEKDPV
jgi:hypothetical protein